MQDVTFGDRTYKVYKTPSSGYIAFVATANFTSGTVNLLEIMKWAMAKGWLSEQVHLEPDLLRGRDRVDGRCRRHVPGYRLFDRCEVKTEARPHGARKQRDKPDAGEQPWPEQRAEDEMRAQQDHWGERGRAGFKLVEQTWSMRASREEAKPGDVGKGSGQ